MDKRTYVIACSKLWIPDIAERLEHLTGHRFVLLTTKEQLNHADLLKLNPEAIFFPHWSNIIPKEIHLNFECVIFHMTDLPYGRGGSPLQNLIVRGYEHTKISAIKCVEGLDAGPVYLKADLSLSGSAQEIFIRANTTIIQMIESFIQHHPLPTPQIGEPTFFQRRKPEQSNLSSCKTTKESYDLIRMLDAEGYPKAFLVTENNLRYEFSNAKLEGDLLTATVRIINE